MAVRADDPRDLDELAGFALRDNPRRAHLIVSRILGKHIPVAPSLVLDGARRLADAVTSAIGPGDLGDRGQVGEVLVVGFCETATGLGHAVADRLEASYLHSTRRPVAGIPIAVSFEEEHSHAVSHHLQPGPTVSLAGEGPLVLVDDELTTGRTALNTIAALQERFPRPSYVIAALIDARTPEQRAQFEERAATLGVPVTVASVLEIAVELPADVLDRAAAARAALAPAAPAPGGEPGEVRVHHPIWPASLAATARTGMSSLDSAALRSEAARIAGGLAETVAEHPGPVLVVGTEELMHLPVLVADALADAVPAADVTVQSTTRSPVHAADQPGYAIRRTVTFDAPDEPGRPSRLHNLVDPAAIPPAGSEWADLRHRHIVVVADVPAESCAGLAEALRPFAEVVHVVPVATRQPFGSYEPADVTWLLSDLSDVELERSTEDREEAIQSGTHYSEMLPIEFQPDAAYLQLFHTALAESADRLATAVGVVGELLLARHRALGVEPVLVSLARAGTPIGVLMRRYLREVHGLDSPHHTISIIRGRGIDEVALAHVLERHPAAAVAFVDGWTGKGAIQRQLTAAVAAWRADHPEHQLLDDELVVLADPGGCTTLHGTRDDFLIPSACLNSTVSGLVSRTVHRTDLIGPGMFHGAKFYAELAGQDVSRLFVDTVASRFADMAPAIRSGLEAPAADRSVTWAGWRAIEEVAASYGIDDINLVKPGVGETTRVLLRRVPWQILVRPDRSVDLPHVLALAEAREVPVVPVDDLPYSCVGLIRQVR
ncbi:phosphoribosyltransferase [Nocardioides caeni]|uniref:Phosphoribosyltransferase n=1 Tax=Nocardioides caeni TaxID=574700 RepID=A0A4S8NPG9_9ACTN|nr:phosphoribosyltransferase [Nocardioides caeni]